jgi:hydroxyacylglutathione hydrolase
MKSWTTKSGHKIIRVLSGRSNVFLLTNGEQNILIDTSPKSKWHSLEKRLKNLNVKHVDWLILTHAHFDHVGNAHRIKEKYESMVIIHRAEASDLTSGNNSSTNGTNAVTRFLVKLFGKMILQCCRYEPCQYDYLVDATFDLKDFGFNATIIPTPGHTIGSMSVVVDNEVAVVGDAMFGVFSGSVLPPYAMDVKQMISGWRILLETDCSVFLPAHGSANSRSLVQKEFDRRKNILMETEIHS